MKPSSFILLAVALSCFPSSLNASQIWAWGDNTYGQLNVPTDLTNAIALSAGARHAVALRADGTLIAWGDNTDGNTNVPPGLTNVVAVDAGYLFSLAVKADGSVVGWGNNGGGPLDVPDGLTRVIAVSAGLLHCLALNGDGRVVAWGDNDTGATNVPPNVTNAVAVSAGNGFSVVLRADGTLTIWGSSNCGPLPVPPDLTNVVAISAGESHILALLSNGRVRAFGCGSGYADTNVPPDLTNVVAVSAGTLSSLALTSDGRVVAWGANTNDAPAGVVGATSISAGKGYTGDDLFDLALASAAQPKVVIHFVEPLSQTVQVGSQAVFSVSASGAPPLSYQWYFGTNALAGATNQHLVLNNVQISRSGTYTVTVTNAQGSATSQPVTLNVTARVEIFMVPTISLTATSGASFRIDYINVLGPTNVWTTLATVTLTNAQQFYPDYSAIGQPSRFYRVSQLP